MFSKTGSSLLLCLLFVSSVFSTPTRVQPAGAQPASEADAFPEPPLGFTRFRGFSLNYTIGEGVNYNSTFALRSTSNKVIDLTARSQKPDECWEFVEGLGSSKTVYKRNLENLRKYLNGDDSGYYLGPRGTLVAAWPQDANPIAKITVRNQDDCYGVNIKISTLAYYITQVQTFCADEIGWLQRPGNRDIVFIIEQAERPPPEYSPRCNYY